MANTDAYSGARPLNPNAKITRYDIDASAGAAIYKGDFVKLINDGRVEVAAAGNELVGVAAAFYNSSSSPLLYHAASVAGYVDVWDDIDEVFIIQSDASKTTAVTFVGNNADYVKTHSGSTTTGMSGDELAATTAGTSTANLRIKGLASGFDAAGPNAWGNHAKLLVTINEHQLRPAGSAVGD